MKRLLVGFLLLLLCAPALRAAETAPPGAVMALGRSPAAAGGAETAAQDAALKDALRQAVCRGVLELADPAALRAKLEAVERDILAQAPRFVGAYGIQASGRTPEGLTVLASVNLDRAALAKALADLGVARAAGMAPAAPLVLTLVSEETWPDRPAAFWWSEIPGLEAAPAPVARALAEAKYRLIDPKTLLGRIPMGLRQPMLSEEQALQLGRLVGAAVVLLGRVRSYPLVTAPGENPSPAAQMEALSVASGQVIATAEELGPVFNAAPGPEAGVQLAAAVEGATRRLLAQAAAAPSSALAPGGALVTMEVSGLRSLTDIMRFEEAVNGLSPMVSELRRESLSGGVAVYRLRAGASLGRLAEELKALAPAGLLVSASETGPERLKVGLTPKP